MRSQNGNVKVGKRPSYQKQRATNWAPGPRKFAKLGTNKAIAPAASVQGPRPSFALGEIARANAHSHNLESKEQRGSGVSSLVNQNRGERINAQTGEGLGHLSKRQ